MKTILVPTDHSKVSLNAIEYAAHLALHLKAKLVLFHAYNNIPSALDIPVLTSNLDLEKIALADLKKIEKRIHHKFGDDLHISSVCKEGFPVDEINKFAKENHVDLIVMGMQGGGFIAEHLVGSITTSLMHKSHCPVLAVHPQSHFKPFKNIVLACDYVSLKAESVLQPLKKLVTLFKAHLYVIHQAFEFEFASDEKEKAKIGGALKSLHPTFYNSLNPNLVEGINHFIAENKGDLLVMIPRAHSLLDNILFEPDTKRLAFHSKVPVLAIHE